MGTLQALLEARAFDVVLIALDDFGTPRDRDHDHGDDHDHDPRPTTHDRGC
jgi:hypothetical protein